MSNLRVGQKVVCIDFPYAPLQQAIIRATGTEVPVPGKIYTVRWIRISEEDGLPYVRLEEIVNPIINWPGYAPGECRFGARRFRPIVSKPTSIAVFKAMLNPSKQRADA